MSQLVRLDVPSLVAGSFRGSAAETYEFGDASPSQLLPFRPRLGVRHIENYLEHWNVHLTPFVWTKPPAEIIKKTGQTLT